MKIFKFQMRDKNEQRYTLIMINKYFTCDIHDILYKIMIKKIF